MEKRMKNRKNQKCEAASARADSLRKKFMIISMLSFLIVMLFTGSLVNVAFNRANREQMNRILNILIENDGELPLKEDEYEDQSRSLLDQFQYGMRYFSVILDKDTDPDKEELRLEQMEVKLDHVSFVDEDTACRYAKEALNRLFDYGMVESYLYKIGTLKDGRIIIAFVNSSIQEKIQNRVIFYTVLICGAGLLLTGLVVFLCSKRAIRSELESISRQKEFITNASHELKTPLAVIRANTELLELTAGESEWTASTLRQVEYMNGLIQNLVLISRAAEQESILAVERLNLAEIVRTVAEPFQSVALQEKKELHLEVDEESWILGEKSQIQQLISILTDNALKYCDPEGTITLHLNKGRRGKQVILTISNTYQNGANVDCSRFFDRFYREDTSHTNQTGYGIGLSMAESICRQAHGQIRAEWKNGVISFICTFRAR